MVDMSKWMTANDVSDLTGGWVEPREVKLACRSLHERKGYVAFEWCAIRGRDWYVNPAWGEVRKWVLEAAREDEKRRLDHYEVLKENEEMWRNDIVVLADMITYLTQELAALQKERDRLAIDNMRLVSGNKQYERRQKSIRRANAEQRSSHRFK